MNASRSGPVLSIGACGKQSAVRSRQSAAGGGQKGEGAAQPRFRGLIYGAGTRLRESPPAGGSFPEFVSLENLTNGQQSKSLVRSEGRCAALEACGSDQPCFVGTVVQ